MTRCNCPVPSECEIEFRAEEMLDDVEDEYGETREDLDEEMARLGHNLRQAYENETNLEKRAARLHRIVAKMEALQS